ncbi:hypothetical protein ECL_02061 [Enterobacter cloacae subsp. cloacae ATCC 13047]|uniref:Uncharacterized protein n=1 Tax=Enterobacter cloacae subsp. cloacae (strain ATCC 13047 / DSM 30054 / NBRC 13535 / NCTC 10005 / WDCM 00083 / NCDC 279-56) TaxID=716541 RepID=A0A0H3CM20_ENTCC|nr:hypothetical protein ECL_02061 [Enterobacter cloacae subsp. cloacae ATCC 13047]
MWSDKGGWSQLVPYKFATIGAKQNIKVYKGKAGYFKIESS